MKIIGYVKQLLADSKRMLKTVVVAGSAIVSLYLLYVYTWAASCSFYLADDFVHAHDSGIKYDGILDALRAETIFMIDLYMNWQGTYLSMFSQAFLSPLNGAGAIQLKIVMILNIIMLFSSILAMFCAISKKYLERLYGVMCFR